MKKIAVCALALAAAFVVGLGGGASAKPKTPLNCHMVLGTCVTKTTTCPPSGPNVNPNTAALCHHKTYKTCAPSRKICD